MALTKENLSTLVNGAQQLHTYRTADTQATVAGAGYFNEVANRMHQHDIINVISSTGGTPIMTAMFVTSATGAAVVVVKAAA